jgi:arsenate reductase
MAEGLLRALAGDRLEVASAGVSPAGFIHELAIEAMYDIGIDIRGQESKGLAEALEGSTEAPLLIVLCELAARRLECLPRAIRILHWHLDDPGISSGSRDDQLGRFRRLRDELHKLLAAALATGKLEAYVGDETG